MRVLLATASPAAYMAPPLLGSEMVVCGPDWADEKTPSGKWRSLRTPVGEYKLSAIASKLPADQKPDVVVCLVDASWRNLPRDLRAFNCPRVLLVADTHHLSSPILGMLRYMTSEPFTRIVFLYDRHHVGLFRSAGVKNLFWFPGLTFPHTDAVVKTSRAAARANEVRFVGQASRFHPRRSRLLSALNAGNIPVVAKQLPQAESLGFYGAGSIGFNASLNGDLNLRVFEILASGSALLTDELAPASGLSSLLSHGEATTYRSADELVEKAAQLLGNPEATSDLGRRGAAWFDAHLGEDVRRRAFASLVVDGKAPDVFAFPTNESNRIYFPGNSSRLLQTVLVYENVQERHRTGESVSIALSSSVSDDVAEIFSTLPRIHVARVAANKTTELTIASKADANPSRDDVRQVWLSDAATADLDALDRRLAEADFFRTNPQAAVYRRRPIASELDGRKHIVLFTDDPESGGVAQYNHNILLALVRAGYRVSCVQSRSESPLIAEQKRAGVAHHFIEYHTGSEFVRTLSDVSVAEQVFSDDPPHLVVFSDCCPVSNLAAREWAMRFKLPYVVVVGFVGAYLAKNFAQFLPALGRQYANAREIVAVSEENLQLLRNQFQLPPQRGVVVHYGRPEKFFAPRDEAARSRLRAELKLPAQAIVSLTTARLTAVKGFQHQLAAMEQLARMPALKNLHFVWAGDGDQRAELEKEISRRGLSKRIHLLGHRWDADAWYNAADIFVLTSHAEGMPLSIMEAMAKGLPVAASAVSGIPEELADTGALLPDPNVSPAETVKSLVTILTAWATKPELRTSLGQSARIRAEKLFREERMINQTLDLVAAHIPSVADKATIEISKTTTHTRAA